MRRDEFVPFPRMVSGKRLSLALDALEALETGKAAVRDRCRGRVGSGHGETAIKNVRTGAHGSLPAPKGPDDLLRI